MKNNNSRAAFVFKKSKHITRLRYFIGRYLVAAILSICGFCFILLPQTVLGAVADLNAPIITIISPEKDSIIETDRPWIEVQFSDTNSGIDENTILLVVDLANVTDQAIIENLTEQTKRTAYKVRYRPAISLTNGSHEVHFYVRDQAGNLAELGWTFTVSVSQERGIDINGTNTLQREEYPIALTSDTLDVSAQTNLAGGNLRLQFSGRGTDYPSGTPDYQYQDYNFYLDRYSARYQYQKSVFITGYTVSPLESELFPGGLELIGNVFTQKNDFNRSELNWSLFSGEMGSSYGLGISIYDITGMTCRWQSGLGWNIGAFFVGLGDNFDYNFIGFQGDTVFNNRIYTQIEFVTENSKDHSPTGSGVTLHLDRSFNLLNLGLDYIRLQPDCVLIGDSFSFRSARGGIQQIGVQTSTTVGAQHDIGLALTYTTDNLNQAYPYTVNQGNVSLDYRFTPATDLNYNVNYLGGFRYNRGTSCDLDLELSHSLSFGVKKVFNPSTLQVSLSVEKSQRPEYDSPSDQIDLSCAWVIPIGLYNLTPSLKLLKTNDYNNNLKETAETRITLDYQPHPDATRGKLALIWNVSDDRDSTGKEGSRSNYLGVESSLYLQLPYDSTLSITGSLKHWTTEDTDCSNGWDKALLCTWKIRF